MTAAPDSRVHLCTTTCLDRIETTGEPPHLTYRCPTHGATLRVGRTDAADIRRCLECGAWFWVEGIGARRTCLRHRRAEHRLDACIGAWARRRS